MPSHQLSNACWNETSGPTNQTLQQLKAVEYKARVRGAVYKHGIPHFTFNDWVSGHVQHIIITSLGPKPYLNARMISNNLSTVQLLDSEKQLQAIQRRLQWTKCQVGWKLTAILASAHVLFTMTKMKQELIGSFVLCVRCLKEDYVVDKTADEGKKH